MLKVVKGPTKPLIKKYRVECPTCGAILEFDETDIYHCQHDGDSITCPCCKRMIYSGWKQIN